MDARDQRIIIFGDSLTHEFADNSPEIWDVDAGSNRSSSSPGSLLASLLLEQGAQAVRTDSRVGRSAVNFFGREATQSLLASDAAFAPTKVVVMLGTNDIGMGADATRAAMTQIRDAYKDMGAEVWAIGPMTYVGSGAMLNTQAQDTVDVMSDVFGGRFIDARPLSVNVGRAGDGVHFGSDSARMTALNLADALLSKASPSSIWTWAAVAAGGLLAIAAWGAYNKRKHGTLLGALGGGLGDVDGADTTNIVNGKRSNKSEAELVRGGYEQIPCKSGLDKKLDVACWSRVIDGGLGGADSDDNPEATARRMMKNRDFRALLLSDEPGAMDVAQDLALENGLKLSASGDRGQFTLRLDLNDPSAPETHVYWKIEPEGRLRSDGSDRWSNEIEVLWNGEWVTFPRKSQRRNADVEAAGYWRKWITERYEGSREYAQRSAAADAWAVAKAIKALPRSADEKAVRDAVYKAVEQDNSEPSELYGANVKRKRKRKRKKKGLAGDGDSVTDAGAPSFQRLIHQSAPGALIAAEDYALEHGLKISDESGAPGAHQGTFEMHAPGAPSDRWKLVHWQVRYKGSEGKQHIELRVANGKTRVERDWTLKGKKTFDQARAIAAAEGWALAKAIHELPLDTSKADVERVVSETLAKKNHKIKQLFGAP